MTRVLPELPDLPVRSVLDEIGEELDRNGTTVLVAPPGTGKTTLVPPALAERGLRVAVAEPRRLATRAAAARMAELLGEQVGDRVGYAVRGERRSSANTRVEVVTSGLLVRRLQSDPELSGVDVVMLDECHERHLDADLLLALLLDARGGLRPDLRVLAASATVAGDRLANLLGEDTPAPIVQAHGQTHPVGTSHIAPLRKESTENTVARAVRTALDEQHGDVLAFLPGAREIARTRDLLAGESDVDVLPLHGRLPTGEQDTALQQGKRRRVVLSTAVAESSLTVPGVRAVVDSGLSRVSRMDHRRGLSGLVTVRAPQAITEQRAGRAGREGPGHAYRCWPEHEHSALARYPEPEIRTAELTRLALELACWGTPDGSALRWWDAPPAGPLAAGQAVLTALGALDASGAVTARGQRMVELGLHPRLSRALLDGSARAGRRTAAEVVALLDDDGLARDTELATALRKLRGKGPGSQRWRREVRRLEGMVSAPKDPPDAGDEAAVVALAHPERLARRRSPRSRTYLMSGGTAVELPRSEVREDPSGMPTSEGLAGSEWLAIAIAERDPNRAHGFVRLAARADQQLAEQTAPGLLSDTDEIDWHDGDVRARTVRRLGSIVLSDKALETPPADALRAALLEGLRTEGLELLHWDADARQLRQRLAFLHRTFGDPWPTTGEADLLAAAETWLEPELSAAAGRTDLERIDAGTALRRLLPWPQAGRLDELAPDRIEVPSGARVRLDYSGEQPALPVRVQEVFGWTSVPTIAEGRVAVLMRLLDPAGRPAAVTGDLESFWSNGYRQVRAELRGQYPKHSWPENPLTASPSRPGRSG
ncbi:ATP-dependent helicase HrpB [Halopolyspora algeriensis]|uniref:ATP-dependent helicase HrpB n=1 Tax=Halopolyspora algeriensis TaxID=1500506 RepID=A0A368VES2_9ACTN|nr:ATP-dependent helicase HrpB [Halopolyspora algeriensis]RCW39626.1 ATP-dependent helicase HrpB [Halopolyspora algeriensis]TQM54080.1 ATP-dependent helicase HrpB [Halopolyspora algeriensis]